ncbi:MAG: single-stranded DNA-binding protein [Clostridia bacterium]|nr:single-stranded DNA-binding protein [Clostridia bacterium]
MNYELMNNNKVYLCGIVAKEGVLSHTYYGENFYEYLFSVKRLSDSYDTIPVLISERIINDNLKVGNTVVVKGQYRSYNKIVDGKSKLVLSVFARDILENDVTQNPNQIYLTGFVCKEPIYRTTPFKREICDILIAVNRAYNKSDYIPCIAWGRNARFVKNFKVGDKIEIVGRIQSRDYQKKVDNDTYETKTAYEISITRINSGTETQTIIECE